MGKASKKQYRIGSVSLYVVIFATLLLSVITVSFIRIMIGDQQQTTNADLSQSAYDSALAGVEDAKTALLKFATTCPNGGDTSSDCQKQVDDYLNGSNCNAIYKIAGIGEQDKETQVQYNDDNNKATNQFNQAYTCVTINPNPTDYAATAQPGSSILIPISLLQSDQGNLGKVRLSWFTQSDNDGNNQLRTANVIDPDLNNTTGTTGQLFSQTDWDSRGGTNNGSGRNPSLMRVQVIQISNSFSVSDFDNNGSTAKQGTMFLYPSASSVARNDLGDYASITATAPVAVKCAQNYTSGQAYACSADISIPNPSMMTYVRITSFYHPATFSLAPLDSTGHSLKFNGVQSVVDSNGRANDLYRRVEARVELRSGTALYPEFAVDLGGSGSGNPGDGEFCKNYTITDTGQDQSGCPNNTQ